MINKNRDKYIKAVNMNCFLILKCVVFLFLINIFLTRPTPVFATVPSPFDKKMQQIEGELQSFNRSGAYEQMKILYEMDDFDKTSNLYLKNLTLMIKTEKEYLMFDKMVKHAIELYDLTENVNYTRYRTIAIDALAYYDYYDYNNSKAVEKLSEMDDNSEGKKPFQYNMNLALLEIDQKNYEKAISIFKEILSSTDIKDDKINQYFNETTTVRKNIAAIYFEEKKYKEAIKENQIAMELINPLDYDYIIDIKFNLAYIHYANFEYVEAQHYIDEINRDYEKTSVLYKEVLPRDAIRNLEANLQYSTGNYELAAKTYYELNNNVVDKGILEKKLAANDALLKFEKSQVDKQLSLLEKLSLEQLEKNKTQKKYMLSANIIIILLLTLVALAIWIIIFYKKQRKKLFDLSNTDELTQIYNRRKIIEKFDEITIGTKCIAFIDIDHFKLINDQYGHVVGDEVLKKIAEIIKTSLRSQDQVGRYGGEEFLAILDTGDINLAVQITERIRRNVENISWEYQDLKTTISIGLVKADHLGHDLIDEADELLYQSKAFGRNRLSYR